MKSFRAVFVVVCSVLTAAISTSQEIPAGTILPLMMSNTVNSAKSKPGEKISGKLMQDVVLPSGVRIPTGARIEGRVVETSLPSAPGVARLAVRFDRLISNKKEFPINVSLRALASMQDVFEAQPPVGSFDDYGTSSSDWTTVQVGGAAVYRGDGTVRDAMQIVGRATDYGAVTAKLLPAPKRGCAANQAESEREQSLWVFSPWACGTYGFEDLNIAHRGTTPPVGTIEFSSPAPIQLRGGSGWLLRVVAAQPAVQSSTGK
jgi:hypothetical protein